VALVVTTLELRGVGVRYPAGGGRSTEALADITVAGLAGGEVTALIGPNGAGKSSLLRRLAGILPGPGEVVVAGPGGRPVPGYLPQETQSPAALTVFESILLARKQGRGRGSWAVARRDLTRVEGAMRELEIEALAFRTLRELSGGQRQLVALAQTLVRDPDILLLDEPTSALDLGRQCDVLALVRRLARERGICVIVSLHDLNQALRVADRVMVLAAGRLAACGTPRDVITPALLAEVYGVEARVETPAAGGLPHIVVERSLRTAPGAVAGASTAFLRAAE
jgi:iron complex transport system ATP-binding protein